MSWLLRPLNELLYLWAKLGKETWPEKYHPVICHLIDVGQVARQLWDRARRKVRCWVTAKLGLRDDETAGNWLTFWAAVHVIGKVSPPTKTVRREGRNAICKR